MWSVSVGLRWKGPPHTTPTTTPSKAGAAAAAATAAARAARRGLECLVQGRGQDVGAMLYYSLDPQFGALLYSVASRYERLALLPDPFATTAYVPPPPHTEVLAYAHALGIHLYTLSQDYAYFLTQVRAGSVIFLVGVGSLVCWKLWEHWRTGSRDPNPSPPQSPPQRRPRGLLASLLEEDLVQDLDYDDDEDPALIHGKYFGPESPCGEGVVECMTPLSSEASELGEVPALYYHADASASISAGDVESTSDNNSLPTDEDSDVELFGGHKRVVRKKHRSQPHRSKSVTVDKVSSPALAITKKHKSEPSKPGSLLAHPLGECWSSESSPGHLVAPRSLAKDLHKRHLGDGSETPDSEDLVEKRHPVHNAARPRHDAHDARLQPEGEEEGEGPGHLSSASLSDLMEKMRHRGARNSLSRENSINSNLSEVLSPQGFRRFPFTREDSVCSNLSDLAPSECSEVSLDVSVRDDLAATTLTCLHDIEAEIDDLKCSVLEMDEEVTRFSSRPNPYTFKTTYSDYSITSGESRPNSALDLVNMHRSRASMRGLIHRGSGEGEGLVEGGVEVSGSEAEGSFEWDSPQHGWTSARPPPLSRLPELPSEDADSSKASAQEDLMPSLEWDNDCLQQYTEGQPGPEEQPNDVFQTNNQETFTELEGFEEYKMSCSRHQLLPDHSSLELDLEEELRSPTGPSPLEEDLRTAAMTVSVDSAIHSCTGSRSTSSSPVPSMAHSLLSSSGLASSTEISPATPDSEVSWNTWDRRLGEFKARRCWSSEESGYMEGPDNPPDPHAHLSPVHELKEKESTESSTSSPHHSDRSVNTTINTTHHDHANNNTVNNNIRSTGDITNLNQRGMGVGVSVEEGRAVAVGPKVDLTSYAQAEWQGTTPKAHVIRQGYSAIPVELNYTHLRRIRGDNYCGIRAAVYQCLAQGLPLPDGRTTHARLLAEHRAGASWLNDWSFGRRLNFTKDQTLNGFWECLEALDGLVVGLSGCENREALVVSRLNGDPALDVKVCEAIKLHMLAAALDLHQHNNTGHNVPLFAMIMFARHTSLTPHDLLRNHLNLVGDKAGLEQDQHKIEMFLLGHTLGVTVQVVRPGCYGQDDFICYYPDANIGVWPEVTLVAEDDRHYNVLVNT